MTKLSEKVEVKLFGSFVALDMENGDIFETLSGEKFVVIDGVGIGQEKVVNFDCENFNGAPSCDLSIMRIWRGNNLPNTKALPLREVERHGRLIWERKRKPLPEVNEIWKCKGSYYRILQFSVDKSEVLVHNVCASSRMTTEASIENLEKKAEVKEFSRDELRQRLPLSFEELSTGEYHTLLGYDPVRDVFVSENNLIWTRKHLRTNCICANGNVIGKFIE